MNTETKPSGITCPEGCPYCAELKPFPHYSALELERIQEFAERYRTGSRFGKYSFSLVGLLAFEQAVLAKRDEELARCWEVFAPDLMSQPHNFPSLVSAIGYKFNELTGSKGAYEKRTERAEAKIESLQAKLAMQAEAIEQWGNQLQEQALNAAQADVDKFMAKKKAEFEAPLQAKIDALMLEYCPDEMTKEQVHGWCVAQRPVEV